jgi:hypothetical protein
MSSCHDVVSIRLGYVPGSLMFDRSLLGARSNVLAGGAALDLNLEFLLLSYDQQATVRTTVAYVVLTLAYCRLLALWRGCS